MSGSAAALKHPPSSTENLNTRSAKEGQYLMDEYYNYAAAKADLEKHSAERNEDENKRYYQLCIWDNALAQDCKPHSAVGDRRTICAAANRTTHELEEALFYVQGIIANLDLPPLKFRPSPQQSKHLRASVTLTGLALEKWQPSDAMGYNAIDIQNRYFTPRKFANGLTKIGFERLCDLNGYLEDCSNAELFHTDDNHVDYYSSADAEAVIVSPSTFRVGDIVEACVSVVMTPISADRSRMLVVLRSLAHIESRHTMNSDTNREIAKGAIALRSAAKLPKRRRAYSPVAEAIINHDQPGPSRPAKRGHDTIAAEPQNAADKQMAVE
ncbi:hypothetical protein BJ138DRAFT_1118469 [Hygrophoropsis aurantiaca]|uniref:Uncharacterized protein n=1 Tax=Hygrophoropsis aurantiaca TaxID=72124 RepID=A0ACB7ZWD3_9AGAM|nr:hypothetical protein BJ138DRAFT_1118469 [Hygrophoropsis aurantiaca]